MQPAKNQNIDSTSLFVTSYIDKALEKVSDHTASFKTNISRLNGNISSGEIRWIALKTPFIALATASSFAVRSITYSAGNVLRGRFSVAKKELLNNLQLCTHYLGLTVLGILFSAILLYRGSVPKKYASVIGHADVNKKLIPVSGILNPSPPTGSLNERGSFSALSSAPLQAEQHSHHISPYHAVADVIKNADRRWHGLSSFARILFQDDQIQKKLLKNVPETLEELSNCSLSVGHMDFQGKEITIGDVTRHALADNDLWYLFTAAPNYPGYPSADEGRWQGIQSGLYASLGKVCAPRKYDEVSLCVIIKEILSVHPDPLTDQLFACSAHQLLQIIRAQFKGRTIADFNQKSQSQAPIALRSQTYCPMADFGEALAYFGNDPAQALSCPVFSHALDADHLMAAIYYMYCDEATDESARAADYVPPKALLGPIKEGEDLNQEADRSLAIWEVGKESLEKLLYQAERQTLSSEAYLLLCHRLRQVLRVMLKNINQTEKVLDIPAEGEVAVNPALEGPYRQLPPRSLLLSVETARETEAHFTAFAIAQYSVDKVYTEAYLTEIFPDDNNLTKCPYIIEVPSAQRFSVSKLSFCREGIVSLLGNEPIIDLEQDSVSLPEGTLLFMRFGQQNRKAKYYSLAVVSVPVKCEQQNKDALISCYLRILSGQDSRFGYSYNKDQQVYEYPRKKCHLRLLGLNMGWSLEESLNAARTAYFLWDTQEVDRVFKNSCHVSSSKKEDFDAYVTFLGYENDPLLQKARLALAQKDFLQEVRAKKNTIGIIPKKTTFGYDRVFSFIPLFAKQSQQGNDSYGIATLYDVTPSFKKSHKRTLEDPQREVSAHSSSLFVSSPTRSLVQLMNDSEGASTLSFLFSSLCQLLGPSKERSISEFSGYNAEVLSIRRLGDYLQIVITFPKRKNTWDEDRAASSLGYEREEKGGALAAMIVEISSTGELSYTPEGLKERGNFSSTKADDKKTPEELKIQIEANRRDYCTSICQLFLEHIRVGTFSANRSEDPFDILFTVCAQLAQLHQRQSLYGAAAPARSLLNPVLCSQDSTFELTTTRLEDEELNLLGLQPGAFCFSLDKMTAPGDKMRGSGATSAARQIKLYQGIDEQGHLYAEVRLTKRDHTRVMSDQSIDNVTTSRLRVLKNVTTGRITSVYIKDEQQIILDGFAAGFGGLAVSGSHQSHKDIVKSGSITELSPDAIEDCKYILQALGNNRALLQSEHTVVDGIYHVDGTVFSDGELLALTQIHQGPIQFQTWHAQMKRNNDATHAFHFLSSQLIELNPEAHHKALMSFPCYERVAIE